VEILNAAVEFDARTVVIEVRGLGTADRNNQAFFRLGRLAVSNGRADSSGCEDMRRLPGAFDFSHLPLTSGDVLRFIPGQRR